MAISQKKYVDITSGVGGEATAARRELIARLFTSNAALTNAQILETDLAGTLAVFGDSSAEYAFALKYFGFISKNISKANKISFAQWPTAATKANVVGAATGKAYTDFTSITSGAADITIDGVVKHLTSLNFGSVTTMAGVATVMQTALNSAVSGTICTYSATTDKFTITNATAGSAKSVSFLTAVGATGLAGLLKLQSTDGGTLYAGQDIETPVQALTRVDETNDNFGSFCFVGGLTSGQNELVSAWVAAGNYKYLYSVSATTAAVQALAAALDGEVGTILTADANAAQAEFMPMALLATTDYDRPNAVKNFMFQKFDDEDPSVTTDALSDTYDALHINYLGVTQQAGKLIQFYQDGYMMDGGDVGPYCNEIWLKDAISTEFMNLLLALEMIPANDTGSAICATAIQGIIASALNNGVIQPGKTLTNVQKAYITQVSGSVDAWRDVQSVGYWLDVVITSEVVNSAVKYIAKYTLIYSKGDSIRKVEGFDILI